MTPAGILTLRANLGDHQPFLPVKAADLSLPGVRFDFCGPKSPPSGFRDMVEGGVYDFGELALGIYLQAVHYRKPVMLLPVTITARFQHGNIVRRRDRDLRPDQMAGKRIGVRAYTQTTAIWIRGILQESYGIDPSTVTWVCTEGSHVAAYQDPPNVQRMAIASDQLVTLLDSGEIDAAIFGADLPRGREDIVPLIADADAAALAWYGQHGYVPVNHMLAVGSGVAQARPDLVRALYRLFSDASAAAPLSPAGIDFLPCGFDAVRTPVEAMIRHAVDQKIIPHPLSFEDVFGEARRVLSP